MSSMDRVLSALQSRSLLTKDAPCWTDDASGLDSSLALGDLKDAVRAEARQLRTRVLVIAEHCDRLGDHKGAHELFALAKDL